MDRENIFNDVPPVVVVLALIIGGVELALILAEAGVIGGASGIGWRNALVEEFAIYPALMDEFARRGSLPIEHLWRFVTFPFIHASHTHALFAGIMTVALGKFVGDRWHWLSLLVIFAVSGAVAALVFCLISPVNWALFGAYPALYGLIGAFTYALWMRLGQEGANRWRAFSMIIFLISVQIVFGGAMQILNVLGLGNAGQPIMLYAGIADLAGFAVGLGLSPLLGPGGWKSFLVRIRQRSAG